MITYAKLLSIEANQQLEEINRAPAREQGDMHCALGGGKFSAREMGDVNGDSMR